MQGGNRQTLKRIASRIVARNVMGLGLIAAPLKIDKELTDASGHCAVWGRPDHSPKRTYELLSAVSTPDHALLRRAPLILNR
jgi:hypothetical protein